VRRWGKTAELIGLAAVVVGLVFVGLELRQNQLDLRAQSRATLSLIDIEQIRSLREDEALMQRLVDQDPGLSSVDEFREQTWMRELARTAEHQFYQYRIGTFDEREFEGMRNLWKRGFGRPRYRDWWEANKQEFSATFRDEFDALLSEN
jgi:hypothetical protein